MNDVDEVRRLIARADPLCAEHHEQLGTTEARTLLASVLATAPATESSRPVPRRAVLTGGLVAAAAVTGAVLVLDPFRSAPAAAQTPPLIPYSLPAGTPAAPELRRIADRTEVLPPEPVTGECRYVRAERWSLNTAVSGGESSSALASIINETWFRPDGTGRERMVPGFSLVRHAGSRETLDAVTGEPSTSDQVWTHDMPDGMVPSPLPDVGDLDTGSVPGFAREAIEGANLALPRGALMAQGVDELFRRQPVPPRARAGVWRLLAAVEGVTYRGEVTDRAARRGAAFTIADNGDAHGLPTEFLLVIDPATGDLLEYDEILTTSAGALNVEIPAVLALSVYLTTGYTPDTNTRP